LPGGKKALFAEDAKDILIRFNGQQIQILHQEAITGRHQKVRGIGAGRDQRFANTIQISGLPVYGTRAVVPEKRRYKYASIFPTNTCALFIN